MKPMDDGSLFSRCIKVWARDAEPPRAFRPQLRESLVFSIFIGAAAGFSIAVAVVYMTGG